jgi:hypothetical protein
LQIVRLRQSTHNDFANAAGADWQWAAPFRARFPRLGRSRTVVAILIRLRYSALNNSMSNGLFIRTYPAPGVSIMPATFRAGRFAYSLLVVLGIWCIWLISGAGSSGVMWWGMAVYALFSICATIYFHNLKLEIRPDGLSYSSLFRDANFLAYSDISTVVLLTSSASNRSGRLWPTSVMPGTMLITPKTDTGRAAFKVPLNLFPAAAREQMVHLLRPEEWDINNY